MLLLLSGRGDHSESCGNFLLRHDYVPKSEPGIKQQGRITGMTEPSAPARKLWLRASLVYAAAFAYLHSLQFQTAIIPGYDGYFHSCWPPD